MGMIRCFTLLRHLSHVCPPLGLHYASSYRAWALKTVGWLCVAKRKMCLLLFANSQIAGTVPFCCPSATGPLGSFQCPIALLLSQLKGCQFPRGLFSPALPYGSRGKETVSLLHPFLGASLAISQRQP